MYTILLANINDLQISNQSISTDLGNNNRLSNDDLEKQELSFWDPTRLIYGIKHSLECSHFINFIALIVMYAVFLVIFCCVLLECQQL